MLGGVSDFLSGLPRRGKSLILVAFDAAALLGVLWLGYQAFGAVVRSSGEQVGLRFDDPIAQDWVLETRELLPVIAQGEDRLRSFAREWVRGHPKTYAAWAGARRGGSRPYRQPANDDGIGPEEALDARTWLLAGRPFLVGGAVIGFVAGYISIFF